jgi:dUTPase
VDADYQGEVHISLVNSSNVAVNISAGEKIIQGILLPVECAQIVEVATLTELYPTKTDRGAGGFGSSGTK